MHFLDALELEEVCGTGVDMSCEVVVEDNAKSICDLILGLNKAEKAVKQLNEFLRWCNWTERYTKIFEGNTAPDEVFWQELAC